MIKPLLPCLGLVGAILSIHAFADEAAGSLASDVKILCEISPQPLADALTAWAELSGIQIVVPQSVQAERTSRRMNGWMSASECLASLLTDTGLTSDAINSRTVAISEGVPLNRATTQPRPIQDFRLNERVVVTRSRMRFPVVDLETDVSPDTPAPVTIYTRRQLESYGISDVAELMKFNPQQPYGPRSRGAVENGAQFVEARGMGVGATLVLVNGRRTAPSASSLAADAFDLTTIPFAAVDRIEVLSGSASVLYGADAIAGVVNIILKKEIEVPALDLHWGTSAGGAEERRVSWSAGYGHDRVNGTVLLDFFSRGSLLGSKRKLWRDQDYGRFDASDLRAVTSNPGNVRSVDGQDLPGLSSPIAAIPQGSSGIGLTPADFLDTAGTENRTSLYQYWAIVPESDRASASATLDISIGEHVSLFAEGLYTQERMYQQYEPTAMRVRVPADNPFNPFGIDVDVDYLFTGVGARMFVLDTEFYRGVAGLRGTWGSWAWELSTLRIGDVASSWNQNVVDPNQVRRALAATDPDESLNFFQDGPGGSPALLASLVSHQKAAHYESQAAISAGVLRGRLLSVPAGAVEAVIGAEYMDSSILFDQQLYVSRSRSVSSFFAQVRVPVISAAMQIPAAHEVSLTMSARQDHYSDFGDTFNPQFGMVWKPHPDWMLRTSFATSSRAPSLFEMYAPRTEIPDVSVPDPGRNYEFANVTFITGGNPDLRPTEAQSFTAGFVFAPVGFKTLQISTSFWQIKSNNRIKVLPYQVIAVNEEQFPGRVIRSEPTADDIAAGLPGKLQLLDISRVNFGGIQTEGLDFGARFAVDTAIGRFEPDVSATWVTKFQVVDFPGTAPVDRLGIADTSGTIAQLRAVSSLYWSMHAWSGALTTRYTSGYEDVNLYTGPTGRRIPSLTLFDVQGSVDLAELSAVPLQWTSALTLTMGVSNLFDKGPHFAEIGGAQGYDSTQGDLRKRFAYLRLSARF